MAERVNWTPDEVAETVSSYFKMLKLELAGKSFNKSEENARLRTHLNGRSKGAVEFKHQNISAVLLENGWIYIDGYKPMKNVQGDLRNEVEKQLRLDSELDNLMMQSSNSMIGTDDFDPDLPELVDVPEVILGTAAWTPRIIGIKRDYVFRDARNRALGGYYGWREPVFRCLVSQCSGVDCATRPLSGEPRRRDGPLAATHPGCC